MQGGKGLDVGDKVTVKLISTNPEKGFIDFRGLSRWFTSRWRLDQPHQKPVRIEKAGNSAPASDWVESEFPAAGESSRTWSGHP